MPDWLMKWLESNWWVFIAVLVATGRAMYDALRRERLSEEKRAEEDRAEAESKASWKELWGALYMILRVAAICAVGLWLIGLTGIGESRAFMAIALTLLWLIFLRLDRAKTQDALAHKQLIEVNDRLAWIQGALSKSGGRY